MSILAVFELGTMTKSKFDNVIVGLDAAGASNPEGRQYHAASIQDDGSIVVTDIWTSPDLLEKFGAVLMPTLENADVTPVPPKVMPIHNVING